MGPGTSSCCLFGRSSVQECWNRGPGVATLCSCWPRRDKGTEEEEEAEQFPLLKCPKGSVAILYVCFVSFSIDL